MKSKEFLRAVKFTLFSISAGVIQILTFTLLSEVFLLPYRVCYLTALVVSVLWNFTLNRKVTFRSAGNIPIAMMKVAAYYAVFTPLSTWGGGQLEAAGVNEYIVLVGSMLVNFVTEFLYDRLVVFGKTIDTAPRREKSAENA